MCWPTRTTSRNVGKRLPAPSTADRSRPPAWGLGRRRGRGPGRCTAPQAASVFPPRLSPLRSSRCFHECYAQSTWPESQPVSVQKRTETGRRGCLRLRPWHFQDLAVRFQCHTARHAHGPPSARTRPAFRAARHAHGPSRRRTPQDLRDPAGSDGGGSAAERCPGGGRHLPAAPPAGVVSVRAARAPRAPPRGGR